MVISSHDFWVLCPTCVTVFDYLEEFEKSGVLRFELDEQDGHYCVVKHQ